MDTRLTKSGRSSTGVFNSFPDAKEQLIKDVYGILHHCNLLYEFLSAKSLFGKEGVIKIILSVFDLLGIASEFLSVTLDIVALETRLLVEKSFN